MHPFVAKKMEHAYRMKDFGAWVDWRTNRRLLAPIGMILPAEAETLYYSQEVPVIEAGT
jgi:hypothetical protein